MNRKITPFQTELDNLIHKFRVLGKNLARKHATYQVGQKIRFNNFPESKWLTGTIEEVSWEQLGADYLIGYWVVAPRETEATRWVFESEIYGVVKPR